MKTQSAKAKGRNLQKWVRDLILKLNPELTEDDVRSTSSGAGGEDVQLSSKARTLVPYNIECKNTEKLSVWSAYDQATAHGRYNALLVWKKNRRKPLAIVDAEHFFNLVRESQ